MLKGKGVSEGIGLGKAVILNKQEIQIEKYQIEDVQAELNIFDQSLQTVIKKTEQLLSKLSGTEKEIMEAYLLILKDPMLVEQTRRLITEEKFHALYATEEGFNTTIQMFEEMEDAYMKARSADIEDMKKKILAELTNQEDVSLSNLPENTIIIAKEMTTSDTAKLDFQNVSGIITEIGGENSHVAIMARTREIPLIVGMNQITEQVKPQDYIAMNGGSGEIRINPTETEMVELETIKEKFEREKSELGQFREKKSITQDGHSMQILANIGIPNDAEIAIQNTAEGIGLFRSEFLYMNSDHFPTEEEQFLAYKQVAEKMKEKKVVIRTLDIGGDKDLKYMQLPKEENPYLGYRAIRICLEDKPLFKIQLKAILRASVYGNLEILLPMISTIEELREAKAILEEAKEELKQSNIPFKKNIKVGIMIEIPSAALMAESLGKECDFFSIGTNDLIQYTIAVERGNEKVSKLYTKFHPAVIQLIHFAIEGAHKNQISCCMCGEAASDPCLIPLLVGLGLDEFSMNANYILQARKKVRELELEKCKKLASKVLKMTSKSEIEKELRGTEVKEG